MFSVALYQIIAPLSSTIDIDSILVHATGRVHPITLREAEARPSSSFWRRFHDGQGNQPRIKEECCSLLYEFPSGNQVDGLPLVAHFLLFLMVIVDVLRIHLSDRRAPFVSQRY